MNAPSVPQPHEPSQFKFDIDVVRVTDYALKIVEAVLHPDASDHYSYEMVKREFLYLGESESELIARFVQKNFNPKLSPVELLQTIIRMTTRKPRGQHYSTRIKLERLKQIRRESIKDGKIRISKTDACKQAPIEPKTAKRHLPALWDNWDNPLF